MLTPHFSHLSPTEQERLVILMEDCSEIIHMGSKILRHGYGSKNPDDKAPHDLRLTNRESLEGEIGQLNWMTCQMIRSGDLSPINIDDGNAKREKKIAPHLHHHKPISYSKAQWGSKENDPR